LADPSLQAVTGGSNSFANHHSISDDGRFVVFESVAANLVAGDNDNSADVFLRDMLTGATTLVGPIPGTLGVSGIANDSAISGNGRFIAFASDTASLVSGVTSSGVQIYIKDMQTGAIALASTGAGGPANAYCFNPMLSADGRFVAFTSFADNLVAGDNNQHQDVFLKDMQTGAVTLVNAGPTVPDDPSPNVYGISGDGRYIAFSQGGSFVKDLQTGSLTSIMGDNLFLSANGRYVSFTLDNQVSVEDLQTGAVTLASAGFLGPGNGRSSDSILNADGRFLMFQSDATNLVDGDTNGLPDTFLKDMTTGSLSIVPIATANQNSVNFVSLALSADGRYVSFSTDASNLVPGDTNNASDVFLRDLQTGTVSLVSAHALNLPSLTANGDSNHPTISADGRYVVFESNALNLPVQPGNPYGYIYRKDLASGTITLISSGAAGPANGGSGWPAMSPDGRYVAFLSSATNLVSSQPSQTGIFVKDLQTGNIVLASTDSAGQSYNPVPGFAIGPNGRYLAFEGYGIGTVTSLPDYAPDYLYLKDLQTGAISTLSTDRGRGQNFEPNFSSDGHYLAFMSRDANLVPGDTNNSFDVFIKDLQTGTITLVSTGASGQGNGDSYLPSLSGDGHLVAFVSDASNLVPGDTNGRPDVFLKDLQTGSIARITDDSYHLANPIRIALSADGRFLAFNAESGTAAVPQVFLEDLQTGKVTLVTTGVGGGMGNGATYTLSISTNGGVLAFDSNASNLVLGDFNSRGDVFVATQNQVVLALNSGGGAAGAFAADAGFTAGHTNLTTAAIDTSQVSNPAPPAVYQTERYGNFSYALTGLTPGTSYTVRLHFAELYWTSAGSRLFNVTINGQQVLNNFDIFATAGGKFKAIVESFTATANASGTITINFSTVKDNAKVSGIEILSGGTPTVPAPVTGLNATAGNTQATLTWTPSAGAASYKLYRGTTKGGESPIPIQTGLSGTSFTDTNLTNGTTYYYEVTAVNLAGESGPSNEVSVTPQVSMAPAWAVDAGGGAAGAFVADTGFTGGTTYSSTAVIDTSAVSNPAPQAVYQTERYGNFTYKATGLTPGVSYTVRLHFAELYFSSAGQRLFNVTINGVQVLSNFDIFAQAGGKNKAIVESFAATADAAGTITIGFISVKNYAKVSGIEIIPTA
jgi:Tol biopolymer transport system component